VADGTTAIPADWYRATVIEGRRTGTKAGKPAYRLTFEVSDGPHAGHRLWLWPTLGSTAEANLAKTALAHLGLVGSADLPVTTSRWARRDSNPHAPCGARDFKSLVAAITPLAPCSRNGHPTRHTLFGRTPGCYTTEPNDFRFRGGWGPALPFPSVYGPRRDMEWATMERRGRCISNSTHVMCTAPELRTGTLVRLKAGGPVMLVDQAFRVKELVRYRCFWLDSLGGVLYADYRQEELVCVPANEQQK
jgi:uncharacterized protein YodC (DUF2158 family)